MIPAPQWVSMPVPKPRALQPGDTLAIVTPASPLVREKTEFAVGLLEAEGYRVCFAEHAFDKTGYLAGSDAQRAADLMGAFLDPEVDAVFCARGGYGCARLFPYLDLDRIAASGKLLCGFSDITTLHVALNRRGLPTLHSPMALTLSVPRSEWVYDSLRRALRGDLTPPAEAPRAETIVGGTAEGVVVGGCLCLMADTLGTPESLDCAGSIVLIEDVDESPHRVDAMLTHLLNAGQIQRAAGIVVGEMTRTDEKTDEGIGGIPWREIVRGRLEPLGIPMVFDFPFGHKKDTLSLGLGIRARLDADTGTLKYLEPLCA
jgi:muramoyltetrapeptide carboxypeptidase